MSYDDFLTRKRVIVRPSGLTDIPKLNPHLKAFQKAVVSWSLRQGKCAMFEATGLGKTIQELEWARVVCDHEQGPVLLLSPLAVAEQTVQEAIKFGIPGVSYAGSQDDVRSAIVVTNYERFDKFNIDTFAGIVLDESSIIKSPEGITRQTLIESCAELKWKLCASATPAPNDYYELGSHAEFLDVMTHKEMLATFFIKDDAARMEGEAQFRLKRHAIKPFWAWLASWSVMIRKPEDLGYDAPEYDLPSVQYFRKLVESDAEPARGAFFAAEARTLRDRIRARRSTLEQRVEAAWKIVDENSNSAKLAACYLTKPKSAARLRHASDTRLILNDGKLLNKPPSKVEDQKKDVLITTPTIKQTKINLSVRQNSNNDITKLDARGTQPTQNIENFLNSELERSLVERQLKNVGGESSNNLESLSSSMIESLLAKGEDVLYAEDDTSINRREDYTPITVIRQDESEDSYVRTVITDSGSSKIAQASLKKPKNILRKDSWILWCNLNDEQEALEKLFGDECVSVYGTLPPEEKVARIWSFINGDKRILISKPTICGFGLNFQFCHKVIFVGLTDSFEATYQAIRRVWRFGQSEEVHVYFIHADIEGNVVDNLKRKERDFEDMLDQMSIHMIDIMRANVQGAVKKAETYDPKVEMELPEWL